MKTICNALAISLLLTIVYPLLMAPWTIGGLLMCFFMGFGAVTLSSMGRRM